MDRFESIQRACQDQNTEPAVELFGNREKNIQKRLEKRRAKNELDSRFRHVFRSYVLQPMIGIIDECIRTTKTLSKNKVVEDIYTNDSAYEIATSVIESEYIDVIYISYDQFNENEIQNHDATCDKLTASIKKIVSDLNNKLASTKLKVDIDLSKIFKFEYGSDQGLYFIYIKTVSGFNQYVTSKFTSFDSFIVSVSEIAMESKIGKAVSNAATVGVIVMAILGLTAVSMPFLVAMLPFIAVAAVVGTIDAKFNANDVKYAQEHPSPEEQASLDVFKRKYLPAMEKEYGRARQIAKSLVDDLNSIGVNAKMESPSSNSSLYAKMSMPVFSIYEGSVVNITKERSDVIASHRDDISKFMNELVQKYDGLIEFKYMHDKKQTIAAVVFTYVDRGGVILPNLR